MYAKSQYMLFSLVLWGGGYYSTVYFGNGENKLLNGVFSCDGSDGCFRAFCWLSYPIGWELLLVFYGPEYPVYVW